MSSATEVQEPEKWIEIKNYDASRRKTIWTEKGIRHDLEPLCRNQFQTPVARQFLAEHSNWVRLADKEDASVTRFPAERIEYVANITGSRLLPKNVDVEKRIDGEDRIVTVPNPLRNPTVVQHRLQGTQKIYGPTEDRRSHKEPWATLVLEPLKRYALSWGDAETILGRDARAPGLFKGRVVRVPKPSSCEPNETWPLDDIRAFAHIVDPNYFDRVVMSKKFPQMGNYCLPGTAEPDISALQKAKKELLDALFPCLIDDRYSKPPTQQVFEKLKGPALEYLDKGPEKKNRR